MIANDQDPRRAGRFGEDGSDDQPVVGRAVRAASPIMIVAVFALLAVVLFLILNARRDAQTASLIPPSSGREVAPLPPPPPLEVPSRPPPAPPAQPVAEAYVPPTTPSAVPEPPPSQPSGESPDRLHAPAVVVDISSPGGPAASVAATAPSANTPAPTPSPGNASNEQFADRVSDSAPEQASATQMRGLGTTIAQGTIIPGVLETALNSDLPGYTRAIVSRDVRSFDARTVLVPRGSRVIGQYRSAVSLGQSRVFIIWSRVIRPDGVSIQIGSPGEDALGRGGLTGDINTHFFARFGSSFLLSVLNGGVAAIAGTPTTTISIGSPAAAAGVAASASIPQGDNIAPTITVKQGAAINIFVARDLDFSAVKPAK